MAGCSSGHYRESADREVYQIIENIEGQIFGQTNEFTIDTPYSDRNPNEILPDELIEDRLSAEQHSVQLDAALHLAVTHSREYQTQKEQLYLTALSLSGARFEFSPQFFADSTATLSGTGGRIESGSVRNRIGVSQLLKTGGSLSVSLANDLLRWYTGNSVGNAFGPGNDSVVNTISVNLAQPLLRGFGKNDPRVESLTQAERNVVYAIRTFGQYQKQFAVGIVNDYFALLGQKEAVRNNYTNYLRPLDSTKYLEARAVDRARKSDVDNSRSSELIARRAYINSLAAYLNQLDTFKITLGIPVSERLYLDDADLQELETAGLPEVDVDKDAGFRIAVERHMDILNAIDRFEDIKRKIRIAADQLKPGLDVVGNASLGSEEPYDYLNFDPDNIRYSVGLQLDLPVNRLRERNNYRATLVTFESQIRSLTLTLDNFKNRIDRGLRTLEQQRLNYLNSVAQLEVIQRRVDMNEILLKAGRTDFIELRQSYDDLINAQNQLTFTKVDYIQARLSLLLDLGVIQTDLDKFWLQDPLADLLDDSQRGPGPLKMPDDTLIPPDHFLEATHELSQSH
ncbi:MAG: TolC family protein [Verrucomicrobiales bacterium]|nr:TolC family protein [Verrucomicrobiales bacterium]